MRKPFRDAYNRELSLLRERAAEFGRDYPELAGRLGGLLKNNIDPTVSGLLEGAAFMAARVQLKLDEEFRNFTREMLDRMLPGLQEPIPAAMLVQAKAPYSDPDVVNGLHFHRGDYLEATYPDDGKRVQCRFSLSAPLSLWPVELTTLRYLSTQGQIGIYQPSPHDKARGGLMLELARIGLTGKTDDSEPLSIVAADSLVFHLSAPMEDNDAVALYEQIHAGTVRVSLRWEGAQKVEIEELPPGAISQIGFGPRERLVPEEAIEADLVAQGESLLPEDNRGFGGFQLLREAFVFPRRFLGFRLNGLHKYLPRNPTSRLQIIFEFDRADAGLQARLEPQHVRLNTAPAVNLFVEDAGPIRVDRKHHEMVATPLSTPLTNYEFHRITDVWAHAKGGKTRSRVYPLYGQPADGSDPRQNLYFTQRRKPRRLSVTELEKGLPRKRYRGTETFIALYEPPEGVPITRLEARGWCSNRHLPDVLPIRQGKPDFYFCDQSDIRLSCIDGPTAPRDALTEAEAAMTEHAGSGDAHWRLISYLQLNMYGISGRNPEEAAASLREMLLLFSETGNSVTEAQIAGLQKVETVPETGQIPYAEGFLSVRGLRVTITFDEAAFEGSGVMLLGAILDRFLADYAGINSFTRTVICSHQRGQIHAFPRRLGSGRPL